MSNFTDFTPLIELIKHKVKLATGCTEPLAVAIGCAKARELLGGIPDRLQVWVTPNMFKNAMGVQVPGTQDLGLRMAAAAGVCGGDPEAGLQALAELTPAQVAEAEALLTQDCIELDRQPHEDVLYTRVLATLDDNQAEVIIAEQHDRFIELRLNGESLPCDLSEVKELEAAVPQLSVSQVLEFAQRVPVEQLAFLQQAAQINAELAQSALVQPQGLGVGHGLKEQTKRGLLGDDLHGRAMYLSAAASDARMSGVPLPAMSNSGSGNQGISATNPLLAAFSILEVKQEQQLRALAMSHLLAIYIKSKQPMLSALCAATTAAMGAGAAITWLLGGTETQIHRCIQTMAADLSGVFCDGANNGCALKVASGASSAVKSALLAVQDAGLNAALGLVEDDADATIANLGELSRQGMVHSDTQIIQIMAQRDVQESAVGS